MQLLLLEILQISLLETILRSRNSLLLVVLVSTCFQELFCAWLLFMYTSGVDSPRGSVLNPRKFHYHEIARDPHIAVRIDISIWQKTLEKINKIEDDVIFFFPGFTSTVGDSNYQRCYFGTYSRIRAGTSSWSTIRNSRRIRSQVQNQGLFFVNQLW